MLIRSISRLLAKCKYVKLLFMSDAEFKRRSSCPISYTLDVFGDKWTLLILRDIMFYDRTRFSDFMPMEHIATNILADRLNKLEAAELITKKRDSKLKNQFTYDVTAKGRSLMPLLIEMTLWGLEHDPESLASKEFVLKARKEKTKVVREISRAINLGVFPAYRSKKMGIDPK
jgi:DNA-binding HxlR family transcriptional regulator